MVAGCVFLCFEFPNKEEHLSPCGRRKGNTYEVSAFLVLVFLALAYEKSGHDEVCQAGTYWKRDCFDVELSITSCYSGELSSVRKEV